MDSNVLLAVATITAALVGGGIVFGVTAWREWQKERKVRRGFIRLLISDISSLLKLYDKAIGEEMKKHDENQLFTRFIVPKHNYFSVFDNTSDKIFYLDNKTSELVVQFYSRAKAHVDTVSVYGKSLEDYCRASGPFQMVQEKDIKELFVLMKNDYLEVEQLANEVVSALKNNLKKHNKN